MAWTIEFDKKAEKEFRKLDKSIQKKIDKFITKLEKSSNPRKLGEALKGNMHSFWRFRVGDYRLVCTIEDDILTVVIIRVSHRKEVYKKNI